MELLKMSTCLCLVLVLLADVMLARPAATDEASELEKFVENRKLIFKLHFFYFSSLCHFLVNTNAHIRGSAQNDSNNMEGL